jgi:tetratricopeptide (TPR) repeat protein
MNFRVVLVWASVALLFASCQQPKPARAKSAIARGQQYLEDKKISRAILEFRLAQRLDPQSADVYFQLANGYLAAGQQAAAYVNLRKALQLDPNHGGAKRAVAQLLASSRNPKNLEEAVRLSESLLEINPNDKDTSNSLAIAKFKLGEKDEAEELLSGLLASGDAPVAAVINASRMRLYQRDTKGALEILIRQEAKYPQSLELALAIGRLASVLGDRGQSETQFQRATRIAPQDPRSWLGLGAFYAQTSQQEKALAALESAAKIPNGNATHLPPQYLWQIGRKDEAIKRLAALHSANLKDSQARARYAQVLRASGQQAQADEIWEQGYQMNPRDPIIMVGHAASLASHGQYSEATTILQTLISVEKRSVPGHSLLAAIYQAQGKDEQARQQWDEVLQADRYNYRARMALVQLQLAGNRADAAAELLRQAPPAQQRTVAWRTAQTQMLMMKKDLSSALASAEANLRDFKSPEARLQLARVHFLRQDWSKALQQLDSILDQPPFSPQAVQMMAEVLSRGKDPKVLLSRLADLAGRDTQSESVQLIYATWLAQFNRLDDSKKLLEALRGRFPDNARIESQLARVEFNRGNLQAARSLIQSVIRTQPNSPANHLLSGDIELTTGNMAGAIAAYRKVVELNPDEPDGLNNLASCLLYNPSQVDEALKLAERAKELRPDDPNTNDTLGWAYYQKGLYTPAIPLLEQSVVNNNPVNRYHLAMALARAGQSQRAQKEFLLAFKTAPNLPEAQQAKAVLASAGSR